MANNTKGNPWTLDTAGVITTAPLKIKRIVWVPSADSDDILIQDNGGHNTWSMKAIAAGSDIEYEKVLETSVNGFNLVTIDGGTAYVYQ
jgi:hypothetical protein